MESFRPKKIAVLRANALGDFIFSLPALTALRETFPKAEIVLLGKPWHQEFLKNRPNPVDRVIVIPKTQGVYDELPFASQEKLEQFFKRMRQEKFDLAIQLHGGGRYSNPFIKQLGAQLTVGLKTPDAEPLDISTPYVYYQNEILRFLEVISSIGASTMNLSPYVKVTPNDLEKSFLVVPDQQFILIHPGASDIRRRWPPEKFAKVADLLIKHGYTAVLTGTHHEASIIQAVENHMEEKPINTCDRLDLSALMGVIKRAQLVIANDTGPLHVAEALKTPTVGIFWCGNLINGGPLVRRIHRPAISWIFNCPTCGTNCTEFPFEPKTKQCEHKTSFVNDVTVEEVTISALELLKQTHSIDIFRDEIVRYKDTKRKVLFS